MMYIDVYAELRVFLNWIGKCIITPCGLQSLVVANLSQSMVSEVFVDNVVCETIGLSDKLARAEGAVLSKIDIPYPKSAWGHMNKSHTRTNLSQALMCVSLPRAV